MSNQRLLKSPELVGADGSTTPFWKSPITPPIDQSLRRNSRWITLPNQQDGRKQREYLDSLSSPVIHHPFETETQLTTRILEPATDQTNCPNVWWYRNSSQSIRATTWLKIFNKQMKTKRSDQAVCSTKDQLMRAFFAYFKSSGLKQCTAPCCEGFRTIVRAATPECRWQHLREALITLVACWACTFRDAGTLERMLTYEIQSTIHPNKNDLWSFQETWTDSDTDFPLNGDSLINNAVESGLIAGHIFPYITDTGILKEDQNFIMEMISLVDWLDSLSESSGREYWDRLFGPGKDWQFLLEFQNQRSIQQAISAIHELSLKYQSLCPHKLWNLASGSTLGSVFSLPILQRLEKSNPFTQTSTKDHTDCTEQFCVIANEDTTNTEQLHKDCPNEECNPGGTRFQFPVDKLSKQFQNLPESCPWVPSAWSIKGLEQLSTATTPDIIKKDEPYIAISHVWSDGTGVGKQKQGEVNRCLINYWIQIASNLDCKGIWWDTVCVPTDRDSRRKAMNMMLKNFENAKYLIIHDQELVNIPYPGDENAAHAFILSTWFTRGWTAAELWATRQSRDSVKIIFKDPDRSKSTPFLVTLDNILYHPRKVSMMSTRTPSLAHINTSRIIGRLRGNVFDLRGLFQILRTRSTSWPKDRVKVASLMIGVDSVPQQDNAKGNTTTPMLTRDILLMLREIPLVAIFHGQMPMKRYGGWSWCPPVIFDLDATSSYYKPYQRSILTINQKGNKKGVARGRFTILRVRASDRQSIIPLGGHVAVAAVINKALEAPNDCLILKVGKTTTSSNQSPGVLVHPIRIVQTERHEELSCRFVGCVYSPFPANAATAARYCNIGDDVDDEEKPLPVMCQSDVATIAG